ncbi:MAG: hypothetical protein JJ964_14025 [Rhizobiales bacterium]|nr:hypothetical protein [Hyphomicrobiales bacterium]
MSTLFKVFPFCLGFAIGLAIYRYFFRDSVVHFTENYLSNSPTWVQAIGLIVATTLQVLFVIWIFRALIQEGQSQ